jgi:cytochrome c5
MGIAIRTFCCAACFASLAAAQSPEQTYRAKCSVCHDGGAGQAPRIDDHAAWALRAARGRAALYATALEGKPNTAMAAKGGFPELTDADTRALVDYMLRITGNADTHLAPMAASGSSAGNVSQMPGDAVAPASEEAISTVLAERLRAALGKPDNRIESYAGVVSLRGVGIKVETRSGVTTLAGTVHDAEIIKRAGEIAAASPGVKRLVNRLISAALFEWD